jgi:hypothetical protein
MGLVEPLNALVWVGSSILTSASLRSTLETGVWSPRSGPEIFSTEVVVWEHQRGGVGGRAYQLCVIMWRFLHNARHTAPAPHLVISNAQMAPGGTNATPPNPPPTQPDSALKSHSQEWNLKPHFRSPYVYPTP